MIKKSLWIAEDDPHMLFLYEDILGLKYDLQMFESLEEMRTGEGQPDLVIADLRFPGRSFINYLAEGEFKDRFPDTPFVVVSCVDDIDILKFCYKKGAADFITKPFGKAEISVKVERLLQDDSRDHQIFDMDPKTMTLRSRNSYVVDLTPKEFQIMYCFQRHNYEVAKDQMIGEVWQYNRVSEQSFNVHLHNLRHKVEPAGIEIKHRPPSSYYVIPAPAQALPEESRT